jgi:hypothetical protein
MYSKIDPIEPSKPNQKALSRRDLLKILTASGGALAASQLVPNEWTTPLVESGVLPAHAQGSPTPGLPSPPLGTGDLQITLNWNTGIPLGASGARVDIDLHVIEPDGTEVYFANRQGPTATLDFDNVYGFGPENIFVPHGNTTNGNYRVYVRYYPGSNIFVSTTCTIEVRIFVGSAQEQLITFSRILSTSNERQLVAQIAFPGGVITELTGTPRQTSALQVEK